MSVVVEPHPQFANLQTVGTTLIELTHSKLERQGEGYEQLRVLFEQPGAWRGILEFFAKVFESETANTAKEAQ